MSVLEDFWYGNIEPSEYDTSSAKEYKEALQRISRNEESLQASPLRVKHRFAHMRQ